MTPLDQLIEDIPDPSMLHGHIAGRIHGGGYPLANVVLAPNAKVTISVARIGHALAALGADQALWVVNAIEDDTLAMFQIVAYSDQLGTQRLRRRKLSISDTGEMTVAGCWDERDVAQSALLLALDASWHLGRCPDPEKVLESLRGLGHTIDLYRLTT